MFLITNTFPTDIFTHMMTIGLLREVWLRLKEQGIIRKPAEMLCSERPLNFKCLVN